MRTVRCSGRLGGLPGGAYTFPPWTKLQTGVKKKHYLSATSFADGKIFLEHQRTCYKNSHRRSRRSRSTRQFSVLFYTCVTHLKLVFPVTVIVPITFIGTVYVKSAAFFSCGTPCLAWFSAANAFNIRSSEWKCIGHLQISYHTKWNTRTGTVLSLYIRIVPVGVLKSSSKVSRVSVNPTLLCQRDNYSGFCLTGEWILPFRANRNINLRRLAF